LKSYNGQISLYDKALKKLVVQHRGFAKETNGLAEGNSLVDGGPESRTIR
jgi:hypothetical protein